MAAPWNKDVWIAFSGDNKLVSRIIDAANKHQGELPSLFADIARYVSAQGTSAQRTNGKKRKLDDTIPPSATATNGSAATDDEIANPTVSFECKNVSVQIPARKKLKLQLVSDATDAKKKEIRLLNPQSGAADFVLPGSQVEQAFCLPVPEKQQRQWNFCIFPKAGAVTADGMPREQIVFTMNETKPDDASAASGAFAEGTTYVSATGAELNQLLHSYGSQVVMPSEADFVSSIPQAHRKGEKGYHVKAHRGSKEGYLFFLSNGVVFGFKKPLSYFPFSAIESISYTSVLQRTFNLVITATEGENAEPKEIEFSMLDQADFAGIDGYIKRHGLNDASMAAQRKAKAYNVNKSGKGGEANGDADGAQAADVVPKTEEELQDEEDELEEDYEASGGESDGEGESSGEEGDEYEVGDGVVYGDEEEDDEGGGEDEELED